MAKPLLLTKEDYKEAVEELFQLVVSINASNANYKNWFDLQVSESIDIKWWLEFMEKVAILKYNIDKEININKN